jgi:tetratricopeptide (TPR) repeat protein
MSEPGKDSKTDKASSFFVRAEEVAATDNFDYAIDLYMEGLRRNPEAVKEGHIPLRRLALIRQGKGGKGPNIRDRMSHGRSSKDPLDEMLRSEYLLSKDPGNKGFAESMLKAASAGGYTNTAKWIAQILYEMNRSSKKPSLEIYKVLIDIYRSLEMYNNAVIVCRNALELKPNDDILTEELRNLSAQLTMQSGKYGQGGGFTESIRDNEKQYELLQKDSLIKSPDYRRKLLEEARRAYEEKPDEAVNILALARALEQRGNDEDFDEAISILEKAWQKSSDFTFKKLSGEIQIKRLKEQIKQLEERMKAKPEDQGLKKKHYELLRKFKDLELEHYRQCVENYPEEMRMCYEYGLRLIINKEYDKAIVMLQKSQKDPKLRLTAMEKTGLCFFLKGWYSDAVDIFKKALEFCKIKDSDIGKELRYNLARSFEQLGKLTEALHLYRSLAQVDYGFRDVKNRVSNLRNEVEKADRENI